MYSVLTENPQMTNNLMASVLSEVIEEHLQRKMEVKSSIISPCTALLLCVITCEYCTNP